MPTVKQCIAELRKFVNPNDHILMDIWTEGDVIERAADNDIKLTARQAQGVLELMDRKPPDANYGVNWDSIDHYTEKYLATEASKKMRSPAPGKRARRLTRKTEPTVHGFRS